MSVVFQEEIFGGKKLLKLKLITLAAACTIGGVKINANEIMSNKETVPANVTINDSVRNWARMSPCVAPIARLKPISFFRSPTEISRMFIRTTPPTMRLRPARAVRRIENVLDVPGAGSPTAFAETMRKSSSCGGVMWCRS